MNKYDAECIKIAYQRSWDIARASIALVSFSRAEGILLVPTSFIDPSGTVWPMEFRSPPLVGLCKSYTLPNDFNSVLAIAVTDTELMLALNDLASSFLDPTTTLYCGRAIDRLRFAIAGRGKPELRAEKQWPIMHEALKIDPEYQKFISQHSTAPRHGKRYRYPAEVNAEVTRRTWAIVDRYIEYKKRGGKPLPLADFPLLKA